jgi:hypothetical protein
MDQEEYLFRERMSDPSVVAAVKNFFDRDR